MWELCKKIPHGRISVRRTSLFASLLVLAIFAQLILVATPVLAADASRTGDTVSYDGGTYTLATASDIPSGLPAGTTGYVFKDTTAGTVSFILTSGDPAKATTGQFVVYPLNPDGSLASAPRAPPASVSIVDAAPNSLTNSTKGTSSCDGSLTGGAGWIICPVTNFLANRMDDIHRILTSFLEVRPVQSDPNSSLYRMWAIVRDIANICFVIVFLVIVYSQITSIGFSNYNLKRMLPRLIIGAILVNTSFWIVALGVDLSNVLGYSVYDLMMGIQRSLSGASQYNTTVPTWQVISAYVLSAGGAAVGLSAAVIAAGGFGAALTLLIPTILMVFLGALAAVAILAARQAIITVCIIVAPLAFVAYVLPSTEKYFEKWKDLMMTMLLMFPLFSLVFAGAQLAGLAIIQNATSIIQIIIGMAVQVAPVVITPMLIKFSGSLLGKVAGMINNPNRGLVDRTRNWSKDRAALHAARVRAGQERSRVFNRNPVNRAVRSRDMSRRRREALKSAYEAQTTNDFSERDNHRYRNSEQSIEAMNRRNAVRKQQIENNFGRTAVAQRLEFDKRIADTDKQHVENEFNASHHGHSADRARRVAERDKHRIESEHETSWNNAVRTTPTLLRGELEMKAAAAKAEAAKTKLEKLHAEVAAQGDGTEYLVNLKGVSAPEHQAILRIARETKTDTNEHAYAAMAKGMAERKAKELIAKDLSEVSKGTKTIEVDGVAIHKYAAGIMGQSGELAVLAKAKTDSSSALVDDIKNIKSTMDYLESTSPFELLKMFKQKDATLEQRVAYATVMVERGGPGNVAIRQAMDFLDSEFAGNPEADHLQYFKELVASMAPGAMKAGKDMEFWLTNSRDSSTNQIRSLKDLSNDLKTWNALQVEAFAGMNMMSQLKALRTVARSGNVKMYDQMIADIKLDSASYANLKPGVKEAMEESATSSYWDDANVKARAGNPAGFDFDNPW